MIEQKSNFFCIYLYVLMVFFCYTLLGSPFKFHVDSLCSGGLTAYGPGLSAGKCGEPCVFTISTKNASGPLLSLSVEGPSKAKVCSLSYFTLFFPYYIKMAMGIE